MTYRILAALLLAASGFMPAKAERLAVRGDSVLAVHSNGRLLAWGSARKAAFGNTEQPSSYYPIKIAHTDSVRAVAFGNRQTVVLRKNGSVVSWSTESTTITDPATRTATFKPTEYPDLNQVTEIAAGGNHILALRNDGTVWGWGANQYSQLGSKADDGTPTPRLIPGLPKIKAIAAADDFSAALAETGTVYVWGYGRPHTDKGPQPILLPQLTDMTSIAIVLEGQVLAADTQGRVWLWDRLWPTRQIPELPPMQRVYANGQELFGISRDNRLWEWWAHSPNLKPKRIEGLEDVVEIAAGQVRVALTAKGDVYHWHFPYLEPEQTAPLPVAGVGNYGQLNLGLAATAVTCRAEATQTAAGGLQVDIPCMRLYPSNHALRIEAVPGKGDDHYFKLIDLR